MFYLNICLHKMCRKTLKYNLKVLRNIFDKKANNEKVKVSRNFSVGNYCVCRNCLTIIYNTLFSK